MTRFLETGPSKGDEICADVNASVDRPLTVCLRERSQKMGFTVKILTTHMEKEVGLKA